jgi:threonine dehydrogenase-like Zn-dependent dehydrogenase
MKAVLFPGNKNVDVVDRPDPVPGFGEVLIKMRASALCRSDMSIYYGKPVVGGGAAKTGLIVPGHEPAGEVVGLGPGATGVKPGDQVAVAGAVMTDMIGTQYSAQKRLGVSGATTLAIFGSGPMGAAGVLIAKARGARIIRLMYWRSALRWPKRWERTTS